MMSGVKNIFDPAKTVLKKPKWCNSLKVSVNQPMAYTKTSVQKIRNGTTTAYSVTRKSQVLINNNRKMSTQEIMSSVERLSRNSKQNRLEQTNKVIKNKPRKMSSEEMAFSIERLYKGLKRNGEKTKAINQRSTQVKKSGPKTTSTRDDKFANDSVQNKNSLSVTSDKNNENQIATEMAMDEQCSPLVINASDVSDVYDTTSSDSDVSEISSDSEIEENVIGDELCPFSSEGTSTMSQREQINEKRSIAIETEHLDEITMDEQCPMCLPFTINPSDVYVLQPVTENNSVVMKLVKVTKYDHRKTQKVDGNEVITVENNSKANPIIDEKFLKDIESNNSEIKENAMGDFCPCYNGGTSTVSNRKQFKEKRSLVVETQHLKEITMDEQCLRHDQHKTKEIAANEVIIVEPERKAFIQEKESAVNRPSANQMQNELESVSKRMRLSRKTYRDELKTTQIEINLPVQQADSIIFIDEEFSKGPDKIISDEQCYTWGDNLTTGDIDDYEYYSCSSDIESTVLEYEECITGDEGSSSYNGSTPVHTYSEQIDDEKSITIQTLYPNDGGPGNNSGLMTIVDILEYDLQKTEIDEYRVVGEEKDTKVVLPEQEECECKSTMGILTTVLRRISEITFKLQEVFENMLKLTMYNVKLPKNQNDFKVNERSLNDIEQKFSSGQSFTDCQWVEASVTSNFVDNNDYDYDSSSSDADSVVTVIERNVTKVELSSLFHEDTADIIGNEQFNNRLFTINVLNLLGREPEILSSDSVQLQSSADYGITIIPVSDPGCDLVDNNYMRVDTMYNVKLAEKQNDFKVDERSLNEIEQKFSSGQSFTDCRWVEASVTSNFVDNNDYDYDSSSSDADSVVTVIERNVTKVELSSLFHEDTADIIGNEQINNRLFTINVLNLLGREPEILSSDSVQLQSSADYGITIIPVSDPGCGLEENNYTRVYTNAECDADQKLKRQFTENNGDVFEMAEEPGDSVTVIQLQPDFPRGNGNEVLTEIEDLRRPHPLYEYLPNRWTLMEFALLLCEIYLSYCTTRENEHQ